MRPFKTLLRSILAVVFLVLTLSSLIRAQSETFDAATFTPPKGWTRTEKSGVVIFSGRDDQAGHFCILMVYGAVPSAGDVKVDFAGRWNELVAKPFNAGPAPQPVTETSDGWTAATGGSQIESDGTKSAAVLVVYTGHGKAVAILSLLNDQSYLAAVDVFLHNLKLDKTAGSAVAPAKANINTADSDYADVDPFPDQPYIQPQKPLTGRLKKSVTIADLVGKWDYGAASVDSYYSASSGNYAGTSTTFFAETYTISPRGTFEKTFAGRTSNHTVREKDSGTASLSDSFLTMDFNGRIKYKYQIVTYMVDPGGAAILTLIHLGDNDPPMDLARLRLNCGHSKGYVTCVTGETWVRRP